jgi:cysteinyl-tRNA synthetase
MIRLIEMLIAKGHAYAAEGQVLFAVPSIRRTTASCRAATATR